MKTKHTIEIECNDSSDTEELNRMINYNEAYAVIRELDEHLRGKIKYHELPPHVEATLQEVRDTLNELCNDRGVTIYV